MPAHAPFITYWKHKFETHHLDKNLNSWSFQYAFLNLINNRISINPNVNLISNIGCSTLNASHFDAYNPAANRALEEFEENELKHPTFIIPDIIADINAQNFEFSLPTLEKNSTNGILFLEEKLREATKRIHSNAESTKIPKIIHQIWINQTQPSTLLQKISDTWTENHPNWKYKLWDESSFIELLTNYYPDFIDYYSSFPYDIQRVHIIRYFILYHYGGLFVNFDSECLEPIDSILGDSTCCLGIEQAATYIIYNKQFVVGNIFMASIPKYPYFKSFIDDIKINNNVIFSKIPIYQIMESTGPFLATRVYCSYSNKDEITLIPAEFVSPLTLRETEMLMKGTVNQEIEEKIEKAFVVHYFMQS